MLCKNCGKETKNPSFCSRKCSAILNNRLYPKVLSKRKCKSCLVSLKSNKTYCNGCSPQKRGGIILQDVIYGKHHKSSSFALVRFRARAKIKKLGFKSCQYCGYNKHIEVAHIKPISDFALDTPIDLINQDDNLLVLCPNCHWEFDHGLLKVAQVGIEPTTSR